MSNEFYFFLVDILKAFQTKSPSVLFLSVATIGWLVEVIGPATARIIKIVNIFQPSNKKS